eukprot:XP_014044325.1 PREDICTED: uncharacterized protein LOC106597693 isoform X1 [Salmo salar]
MDRLLSSDDMNVPDEETVVTALLSWVRHDVSTRQPQLPSLLAHIRLPLLEAQVCIHTCPRSSLTYDYLYWKHRSVSTAALAPRSHTTTFTGSTGLYPQLPSLLAHIRLPLLEAQVCIHTCPRSSLTYDYLYWKHRSVSTPALAPHSHTTTFTGSTGLYPQLPSLLAHIRLPLLEAQVCIHSCPRSSLTYDYLYWKHRSVSTAALAPRSHTTTFTGSTGLHPQLPSLLAHIRLPLLEAQVCIHSCPRSSLTYDYLYWKHRSASTPALAPRSQTTTLTGSTGLYPHLPSLLPHIRLPLLEAQVCIHTCPRSSLTYDCLYWKHRSVTTPALAPRSHTTTFTGSTVPSRPGV